MLHARSNSRPRLTYADLLRSQADWKYSQFKHAQDNVLRRKIRAYRISGMGLPLYSAHQIVDGKKDIIFRDLPNIYLSNFFGQLQANMGNATRTNTEVSTAGAAFNSVTASSFFYSWANGLVANNLGSDTSTATTRGNWKPTTAITVSAPTYTAIATNVSSTFQAVNYNQAQVGLIEYVYAINATSGNPTVGEILFAADTVITVAFMTRLAAGDGLYSAFTITSNLTFTISYTTNWPNP